MIVKWHCLGNLKIDCSPEQWGENEKGVDGSDNSNDDVEIMMSLRWWQFGFSVVGVVWNGTVRI